MNIKAYRAVRLRFVFLLYVRYTSVKNPKRYVCVCVHVCVCMCVCACVCVRERDRKKKREREERQMGWKKLSNVDGEPCSN